MSKADTLSWQLVRDEGGTTLVILRGLLDEDTQLEGLAAEVAGPVCFDLEHVRRVNSVGVVKWIEFVEAIEKTGPHQLRACSPSFVDVLNRVPAVRGSMEVVSVLAPYFCEACERSENVPISLTGHADEPERSVRVPPVRCVECDGGMDFDDVEDAYFRFLIHPPS